MGIRGVFVCVCVRVEGTCLQPGKVGYGRRWTLTLSGHAQPVACPFPGPPIPGVGTRRWGAGRQPAWGHLCAPLVPLPVPPTPAEFMEVPPAASAPGQWGRGKWQRHCAPGPSPGRPAAPSTGLASQSVPRIPARSPGGP